MLERDYILEIVSDFARGLARALRRATAGETEGIHEAEAEVAALMDLEPEVALALSPDSLVTMLALTGIGDQIAACACYGLARVADLREQAGETDAAGLRRLQARAVAESFGCDPAVPPAELAALHSKLFSGPAASGAGEKDPQHVA